MDYVLLFSWAGMSPPLSLEKVKFTYMDNFESPVCVESCVQVANNLDPRPQFDQSI